MTNSPMNIARSVAAGCLALVFLTASAAAPAHAAYVQNFDVVVPPGWAVGDNNNPDGPLPNWYQGVPVANNPLSFDAFNGPANSYAAASFLATGSVGQVDTWLFSPELILTNGDTFSFYARQQNYIGIDNIGGYANALQARLSTSGASTNIGAAYGAVGDFSSLLVDINPGFSQNGMPDVWTQYNFVYNGAAATGRVGFRFYTPNVTLYGSYIGVDAFETTATVVPEPAGFALMAIGIAGMAYRRRSSKASA
jgi:hypothetical protein